MDADRDKAGRHPPGRGCKSHKRDHKDVCISPESFKGEAGCREAGRLPKDLDFVMRELESWA